jgi:hypothetical protein
MNKVKFFKEVFSFDMIDTLMKMDWREINIKDVYKGCNSAADIEAGLVNNPEQVELYEKRIKICGDCSIRTGNICDKKKSGIHEITGTVTNGCNCNVKCKSGLFGATCPLGKW